MDGQADQGDKGPVGDDAMKGERGDPGQQHKVWIDISSGSWLRVETLIHSQLS